jgi:uncharacterized protein YdhG (YjbR/CyaY superfamily)
MSYKSSPRVTEYIDQYTGTIHERLTLLRETIQAVFPHTIEDISYGMPAYRPAPNKRGIVYFAYAKDHIGIYGIIEPTNNSNMAATLAPFRTGKGTLQFAHTQPFPIEAIRDILKYYKARIK